VPRYCPSRIGMSINGSPSFRIIRQPKAAGKCHYWPSASHPSAKKAEGWGTRQAG
jgi:hypothetical protein